MHVDKRTEPLDGRRVAEARRKQKLTQEELASRAGVTLSTIRRIESLESANVFTNTVLALANVLNVKPTQLYKTNGPFDAVTHLIGLDTDTMNRLAEDEADVGAEVLVNVALLLFADLPRQHRKLHLDAYVEAILADKKKRVGAADDDSHAHWTSPPNGARRITEPEVTAEMTASTPRSKPTSTPISKPILTSVRGGKVARKTID